MKTEDSDLYEQIGNLFYAIAANQHIRPLEVPELKSLINSHWHGSSEQNDVVASYAAHIIILTMDTMQGEEREPKNSFDSFSKFYHLNPQTFSSDVRQRIRETATEIARIFKADSPQDNVYVQQLERLLSKPVL